MIADTINMIEDTIKKLTERFSISLKAEDETRLIEKILDALTEDILQRYDNEEYWDNEVAERIGQNYLADTGLKQMNKKLIKDIKEWLDDMKEYTVSVKSDIDEDTIEGSAYFLLSRCLKELKGDKQTNK